MLKQSVSDASSCPRHAKRRWLSHQLAAAPRPVSPRTWKAFWGHLQWHLPRSISKSHQALSITLAALIPDGLFGHCTAGLQPEYAAKWLKKWCQEGEGGCRLLAGWKTQFQVLQMGETIYAEVFSEPCGGTTLPCSHRLHPSPIWTYPWLGQNHWSFPRIIFSININVAALKINKIYLGNIFPEFLLHKNQRKKQGIGDLGMTDDVAGVLSSLLICFHSPQTSIYWPRQTFIPIEEVKMNLERVGNWNVKNVTERRTCTVQCLHALRLHLWSCLRYGPLLAAEWYLCIRSPPLVFFICHCNQKNHA